MENSNDEDSKFVSALLILLIMQNCYYYIYIYVLNVFDEDFFDPHLLDLVTFLRSLLHSRRYT